jgi:hypothetical protein
MGKRKKATTGAQIREEIRRLNLIAKSEFRRSFDEEAAVDLLLRLGLSEVSEVGISPVIKYRLLVGGVGIAYEGESEAEVDGNLVCLWLNQKPLDLDRPESL